MAFCVTGDTLIGIDSSDYSFGYVLTWQSQDPKQAVARIKECAGRIQRASKAITEFLQELFRTRKKVAMSSLIAVPEDIVKKPCADRSQSERGEDPQGMHGLPSELDQRWGDR